MRVLVVSQYFHPENFRVNDLVSGLVSRGHEVSVLTGQPNYPRGRFYQGYGKLRPQREKTFGAIVHRVPMVARGKGGAFALILNYLSFALSASILCPFLIKGPFDVIFVFEVSPVTVAIPAIVASRRFKAPILFWVLDLWPESLRATGVITNSLLLRWAGRAVKWIYAQCDQILVQSRAFIPGIEEMGVAKTKLRYFPNWIETEYERQEKEGARSDHFNIVYAGNIGASQDFPAILDAAEKIAGRLPGVIWTLAGDGRMAEWVRAEVVRRGLGNTFRFLGQLPPASMPELFASADALLVSLKPDPIFAITVPGKVQSYLASSRPVLAMLDGEGARIIEEAGGGFTAPPGDSEALAQLVARLAAMPKAERDAMGQRGRDYARSEFGRERLFDSLECWMEESASRRGQSIH